MKTTKSSKKNENPRASLGEFTGTKGTFSVVQVIRALGKAGLKARQVNEALTAQGFKPNMHTVYLQTTAGRRGVGPMADLSRADLSALKAGKRASKKAAKKTKKETTPEVAAA